MIVAFDIDGVLADNGHRDHFIHPADPTTAKNWSMYYATTLDDTVVIPIYNIAVDLGNAGRHQMYLCTGRHEKSRADTTQWMKDNGLWRYFAGKLMMRPDDVFCTNAAIKRVHAETLIAQHGHIDLAFEDNPSSVEVWKEYATVVCHVGGRHILRE